MMEKYSFTVSSPNGEPRGAYVAGVQFGTGVQVDIAGNREDVLKCIEAIANGLAKYLNPIEIVEAVYKGIKMEVEGK